MTDLTSKITDIAGTAIVTNMALSTADAVSRRLNPRRRRKKKQRGFVI